MNCTEQQFLLCEIWSVEYTGRRVTVFERHGVAKILKMATMQTVTEPSLTVYRTSHRKRSRRLK